MKAKINLNLFNSNKAILFQKSFKNTKINSSNFELNELEDLPNMFYLTQF